MSLIGPVKIIGCGLIGTSIALRLKELGIGLILADTNEMNLRLATDLIGESNKGLSKFHSFGRISVIIFCFGLIYASLLMPMSICCDL
mgnify:CR=1 FL=1